MQQPSSDKCRPLAASESGGLACWDYLGTTMRSDNSATIYLVQPEPFQRYVYMLEAPKIDVLHAALPSSNRCLPLAAIESGGAC